MQLASNATKQEFLSTMLGTLLFPLYHTSSQDTPSSPESTEGTEWFKDVIMQLQ